MEMIFVECLAKEKSKKKPVSGISLDVTWRGFENRPTSRLPQITASLRFYPFSVSRDRDHPLPFQFAANSWNRKKNRSFSFLFFFFRELNRELSELWGKFPPWMRETLTRGNLINYRARSWI